MSETTSGSYAFDTPVCPLCGQGLPPDTPPGLARCPHCGGQFVLADPDAITAQVAPPAEDERPHARAADELSGLRIHHVAAERRAAYRARSYAIIAAGVCVVATAQFSRIAYATWRQHLRAAAIADELAALAALLVFGHFARKAFQLTREIRASRQKFPVDPPDFSALGDGSQRVAALEHLAGLPSSSGENATTEARRHGGAPDGS